MKVSDGRVVQGLAIPRAPHLGETASDTHTHTHTASLYTMARAVTLWLASCFGYTCCG